MITYGEHTRLMAFNYDWRIFSKISLALAVLARGSCFNASATFAISSLRHQLQWLRICIVGSYVLVECLLKQALYMQRSFGLIPLQLQHALILELFPHLINQEKL